ncbi:hypothetical protein PAPYR_1566 [Paratrimastix pyriformis]|uniref:Uncharacterized protein n=1 Tax=Paratrimastix pyriformis TaxID=342808 RepID=A0ABQ8UUX1_9EUKA|nr:hypothetical protein PAPYR_1566 [Paratrimastix pyriformis]
MLSFGEFGDDFPSVLSSLQSDKDENTRSNALVFIQENALRLLRGLQDVQTLIDLHQALSPTESAIVRCQFISTVTTLLILTNPAQITFEVRPDEAAFQYLPITPPNPRPESHRQYQLDHEHMLDQFARLLVDVSIPLGTTGVPSRAEGENDRMIRATACLSLAELERTFPTLLADQLMVLVRGALMADPTLVGPATILVATTAVNSFMQDIDTALFLSVYQVPKLGPAHLHQLILLLTDLASSLPPALAFPENPFALLFEPATAPEQCPEAPTALHCLTYFLLGLYRLRFLSPAVPAASPPPPPVAPASAVPYDIPLPPPPLRPTYTYALSRWSDRPVLHQLLSGVLLVLLDRRGGVSSWQDPSAFFCTPQCKPEEGAGAVAAEWPAVQRRISRTLKSRFASPFVADYYCLSIWIHHQIGLAAIVPCNNPSRACGWLAAMTGMLVALTGGLAVPPTF